MNNYIFICSAPVGSIVINSFHSMDWRSSALSILMRASSSRLSNSKELAMLGGANGNDKQLLTNSLPNLQRLFLQNASFIDLWSFVHYPERLNKIKILSKDKTLNKDRERLARPRQVTIYVPNNISLGQNEPSIMETSDWIWWKDRIRTCGNKTF